MQYTKVISPSVALPLSLAELRAHIRLSTDDPTDEDPLIMGYLRSAIAWIDGPDGWLGRCLITQTLETKVDRFPGSFSQSYTERQILLPCPPVQSVTTVHYVDDPNGNSVLLDDSIYQVVGVNNNTAKLVLAYGEVWPITRPQPEAVTIQYVAGYGDDWNSVPESIRQALMMLVAYWYNQREAALIDPVVTEVPMGVKALLAPYKTHY